MSEVLELGNGRELIPALVDGELSGYWFRHPCQFGSAAPLVKLRGEGAWVVVQQEPLTLAPSLHCLDCGTHGHVQNGQWVGS